jgi:oligopeptide transport system substrate-binding protein
VRSGKRDAIRYEWLSVYWYEVNTRKPPLDDVRVRRALDRAIDKRLIVESVTRGGQTPATHYVPDGTGAGYDVQSAEDRRLGVDPFAGAGFDPEAARALLAEAGYRPVKEGGEWRAPGFPPVEILYNTGEGHRALAVAVQAMWKEHLGVSVTIRNLEWKVLLKAHRDGDFQIIRAGQLAEYDHPNTFLAGFAGDSPQNHSGWRDAAFDETLARAAATADPRASIQLYRRAERQALDAMPRIPLYFYARTTLVKPWVKGFRGNKHKPHDLQFLWIDPEWQAHAGVPDAPAFLPPDLPSPAPFLGEGP